MVMLGKRIGTGIATALTCRKVAVGHDLVVEIASHQRSAYLFRRQPALRQGARRIREPRASHRRIDGNYPEDFEDKTGLHWYPFFHCVFASTSRSWLLPSHARREFRASRPRRLRKST